MRESDKLLCEAHNNMMEGLYSQGINQYKQVIRLVESKKELKLMIGFKASVLGGLTMHTTYEHFLVTSFLLMYTEYCRFHYKEAIDYYNNFMTSSKYTRQNPYLRSIVSLYYQLIMLRLDGRQCQLSDFIDYITLHIHKDEALNSCIPYLFKAAVSAFRAHKQFDLAIRLEISCGSLVQSPIKSKISLALTYLEQYRVEFRQRSQTRKEDIQRIDSLIDSLQTEYPLIEGDQCVRTRPYGSPEYFLVLAQWYYLSHTTAQEEKSITMALSLVKCFLPELTRVYVEKVRDHCHTCGQAATPTEVQYICSGCRVACYCSIDHQRATWKKEAVKGTRIGHEILCPLFKASRKYYLQKESEEIDEEKESKMERRFDRECVQFLEYGLGLKNTRFPCES